MNEIKFEDFLRTAAIGSTVKAEICMTSGVSFQLIIPEEECFDMMLSLMSDKLLDLRVEGMAAEDSCINVVLENADLLRPEEFKGNKKETHE